jgi:hypothetical protein
MEIVGTDAERWRGREGRRMGVVEEKDEEEEMMQKEKMRKRVKILLSTQASIQKALHEIKERHPHREKSINYLDIMELGNRISTTLHAPRHWRPGALLLSGHPPAPQAEQMRKGKLGNLKLNLVTPNYSEILSQIQQEIQLTAKLTLSKRSGTLPTVAPTVVAAPVTEKRIPVEHLPPPEVPAKKQRTINISFGFESDSDGD